MASDVINVVGAGIAGSITARLLRKNGFQVRVFDDGDPLAGSRASSNLFIASWLKKFESSSARLGISVLEDLFAGKIDQPFSRGVADAIKVRHVAQRHLLVEPDEVVKITGLDPKRGLMWRQDGVKLCEGPIVLCTGCRTALLGEEPIPEPLVGHCALFRGRLQEGRSSLLMPLPYRHFKLYQYDEDLIYFADSTALKPESYRKRRSELQSRLVDNARAAMTAEIRGLDKPPLPPLVEIRVGHRPCLPGHPFGRLRTVAPGVWSMNGGGKNGMVCYAALAHRLLQELKR